MQRQSFSDTLALLKADIQYRCVYEQKPYSRMTALKMLISVGVSSVVLYRFQTFFYRNHLKPIAFVFRYLNLILFSVDIDPRAEIGPGLVIIHAHSVYISQYVVAGRNLLLFHQNSIGYSPFFEDESIAAEAARARGETPLRAPLIGDNVIVGAGASICGPVKIGDGCKIAVNSTVDTDCPPGSVMFGVPARQVSKA